ncbi:oligosaccharide flippase family protein [Fertoebacter nigrum]|uniref:Oligosaccharide flippase family protein n=1 Tax=Fertoeibacter niger TaxID=2656921 RepID=A0A8X8KQP1_9RHOB|nr:oligosaccharide flippase family protein [Fertoeibacter niger]NUB46455.1 oligosaccharide flippase family protein [Fertoeibacter niger]
MRLPPRLIGWSVPLLSEAAALARSAILARMIGGEELGRAMMLMLVLRLAEMVSDVGIERFLIRQPGDVTPRLLAALHGAALLRGLGMAALLVALALPMAASLQGGASAATYAALALAPLMRGWLHLGYRLAERDMRLGPMAVVEGGALLAMLAAVVPAVAVWDDHRAMLAVLLAQAGAQVALSHRVGRARFRLAFDRAVLAQVLGFGAPLVLNAGLMFLTFQADRLIVAGWYGWAAVAVYGVALQLAMLPAQIAGRAAGSLLAPRLRDVSGAALVALSRRAMLGHLALGAGFAAGFTLVAPFGIALVYGPAFRPDLGLTLALGLAAGARILRTPLSQLAVVLGRTGDPARANLWRAAALAPALVAASLGLPLTAIAAAAALGEAAATCRALHLARGILFPLHSKACP